MGNESKCWDRESFAIGRPIPEIGVAESSLKTNGKKTQSGDDENDERQMNQACTDNNAKQTDLIDLRSAIA